MEQLSQTPRLPNDLNRETTEHHLPPDQQEPHTEMWNNSVYGEITRPLSQAEIRLVTLRQGPKNSHIECSLSTTKLSECARSYSALSYRWGDQTQQKTIFINSHHFKISKELHTALACLRQPSIDLPIWVDSLCINQSDLKEKEQQVDLMHKIYEGAKSVISWLGEDSNELINGNNAAQLLNFNLDIKKCFKNLFSREYWTRAWIVQEVMSSQPERWRLRCGTEETTFSRFLEVADTLCTRGVFNLDDLTDKMSYSSIEIPEKIRMLQPSNGTRKVLSLTTFLDIFLDCKCSDPRDNLFAFKHLFDDRLQQRIIIDYRSDKEVLIPHIFSELIKETQSLYILTIRAHQIQSKAVWQGKLPSWCPFVGTPYKVTCTPQISGHSAEVGRRKNGEISFENCEGRLVLKTTGTVLGEVCRVQHSQLDGIFKKFDDGRDRELSSRQFQEHLDFIRHFHFRKLPPLPQNRCESTSPSAFGAVGNFPRGVAKATCELENSTRGLFGRAICLLKWEKAVMRRDKYGIPRGNVACAWVPNSARRGDRICLLSGYRTAPILLRRKGESYRVIGDVWVQFAGHIPEDKKLDFRLC